jgi:uncharacterized protein YndB with AHSA1/START domain
MRVRSVIHDTFVIERKYPASPRRVFAAFSDPAKKRRWFGEGEEFPVEEFVMDFRVGGTERKLFRLPNGLPCRNDTVYMDIVPERRIVFAYTMTLAERCFSSSQATVELLPEADATVLIFTDQGAYFEGADGSQIRKQGWEQLFENLAARLPQFHD